MISPFRYDVVAQLELFELIADHSELVDDLPALAGLAHHTAYGAWFDETFVVQPGQEATSDGERERALEEAVRHSVNLYRGAQQRGVRFRPVSVRLVPAGSAIDGRRLAEDRWVALDSAPRLALMHLSGTRVLARDEYVVRLPGAGDAAPCLAPAERLDPVNFVQFLARGLVVADRRHLVRSWADLIDQLAHPANRDALETWPEARWRSTALPGGYDVES